MDLSRFALFVSLDPQNPVPVTRFGPGTLIAADRDGRDIRYRPEEVVAITARELAQYGREYGRALRDGSLRKRTEADYRASLAKQAKAERQRGQDVEKRKAEAKRKAERQADEAAAKQAEAVAPQEGESVPTITEEEIDMVTEELTGGS